MQDSSSQTVARAGVPQRGAGAPVSPVTQHYGTESPRPGGVRLARADSGATAARSGAQAPDELVPRGVGGAARAARRARVGFRRLVLVQKA